MPLLFCTCLQCRYQHKAVASVALKVVVRVTENRGRVETVVALVN